MKLVSKRPPRKFRRKKKSADVEKKQRSKWISDAKKRRAGLVAWCAIMLAIAAVPAIFMNTLFGYLPVIAVALIIIFSYGYMRLLKKIFRFEEISDFRSCRRGEASAFGIRLSNPSVLVFPRIEVSFFISDIFGGDGSLRTSAISLAPREDRDFKFDVRFNHIGLYEAGLKKVVIHDLLGLFQTELVNTQQYQIRVAPKIFDVAKLTVSNATFVESKDMRIPISREGMDYTGVRDYVRGDPIKLIHWKLSARTGNYVTRQFESYGNTGLTVIMDFFAPLYDMEGMMSVYDGIVETALSLELYAKKNGMDCELQYVDRNLKKKRYASRAGADVFDLISDLPNVSADPCSYTADDLLAEEAAAAYGQGNIAFCTSRATPELTRMLVDIKAKRKNPLLFVVIPDSCFGEARKAFLKPLHLLNYARIPYYVIGTAEELQGGERRNVS